MSMLRHYLAKFKATHPAIIAASITLVIFVLPLIQGLRFIGVDATLQDIPYICEFKRLLLSHQSILLSPRIGNGQPLLADLQSELLYPFRWLFFFCSPVLQKSLEVVLHLSLASFAMTLLLKKNGISKTLSVLGGVSYALSGTVLDLIDHGPYIVAAVWIPMAWVFIKNILCELEWKTADFCGLLFCLLCLLSGGEPQSFAIVCGILLLEFICSAEKSWKKLLPLLLAPIFSLCLFAPVLMAAFAEMKLSTRFTAIYTDTILQWSMDLPSALATIWPAILHEPVRQGISFWQTWSQEAVGTVTMPWNWNPYLSILIVASAASTLLVKRARVAALIIVVGLIFSCGSSFLIKLIPFLGSFRYPMKYFLLVTIATWVAAFIGLDRVLSPENARARRILLVSFSIITILQFAAIIVVYWNADYIDSEAFLLRRQLWANEDIPLMSSVLMTSISHALGFGMLGLLCLAIKSYRGYRVECLLPWIILLDLGLTAYSGLSLDYNYLSKPSALSLVLKQEPNPNIVLCHDYSVVNVNVQYTRPTSAGETTIDSSDLMWKFVDIPNLNACDGVVSAVQYSMLEQYANFRFKQQIVGGNIAASIALGCTHLVSNKMPIESGDFSARSISIPGLTDARKEAEAVSPKLFRLADSIQDVFLVKQPKLHAELDHSIQAVLQSKSAAEIVNQIDDPLHHLGSAQLLRSAEGVDVSGIDWPSRTSVALRLKGSGAAVLGLKTIFASGWMARQAGIDLPIVRVAGNLVGVVVPEVSNGQVIIEYQSPHLALGLLIAGLSALVLGLWLLRKN